MIPSLSFSFTSNHSLQAYDKGFVNSVPDDTNLTVVAYGVTKLSNGIHPWQGILVEMLLTLMLVMVFIHTTVGKNPEYKSTAPLLVGLTIAAGTLSG